LKTEQEQQYVVRDVERCQILFDMLFSSRQNK